MPALLKDLSILDELERLYRNFYRQNARLPTVLMLPVSWEFNYRRELHLLQYRPYTAGLDLINDECRHKDCLIVLSRCLQQPVFAWTPERVA